MNLSLIHISVDKYGEVHLKHVGERTWKNKHKKKKFNHKDLYPELMRKIIRTINDCIVQDAEAGLDGIFHTEQ